MTSGNRLGEGEAHFAPLAINDDFGEMPHPYEPVSTMPEGVDCWCIQATNLGSPAPFLMSRDGDVFLWEPEGMPASVVPTHWAPHEPGKPAPWPQEDLQ